MAEENMRVISLRARHGLTKEDLILSLRAVKTSNEKIIVKLGCYADNHGFRFSDTLELRELISGMKINIHELIFSHDGKDNDEYLLYFNYFVTYVETNNGETKNFVYWNNSNTTTNLFLCR